MKNLFGCALGFYVTLFSLSPVYAFQPVQAPILSAAAVTPNVMFLLDNSGSMNNAIIPAPVDQSVFLASYYIGVNNRNQYVWKSDIEDANVSLDSMMSYECNNGYKELWNNSRGNGRCYLLPDPVGGGGTRYTSKYLAYIYNTYRNSYNNLTSVLPAEYRMKVARDVVNQLVTDNRDLRYGLFSFNPAKNTEGGILNFEIANFSRSLNPSGVEVVSAEQATTNFDNFKGKVNGLSAKTNTPLAEAYYEISRYFRGMDKFQGGVEGTYTSPIQYRCQKNFGIVVTDGLPTYDRTFPENDPLRKNSKIALTTNDLPNWDGSGKNTDGANLQGDGEGDTLYLDDIAGFAYDIDMRSSGNDLAGKSFDDVAFKKQNMSTYTVGFAVNNQMLADAADKNHGHGRYFTANNSAELSSSLTQAINEISAQAGSGGAGASSSATLTAETRYYKTLYDPANWSGTIEAYRLSPSTGRIVDKLWSTDTTITPASNSAAYQTFNTTTKAVVSLSYSAVSAAQQAELNSTLVSPATGAGLVNWVKGSNVTGFRTRTVLLGDVINSSLERLAPTDKLAASVTGDTSYSQYLTAKTASSAGMKNSLLVNGNDGLFHVIDADSGAHRYGYLASSLFSSLKIVSAPDYATSKTHRFMADGPIAVADAQLGANWATLAIAGLGAGGKSVFAVKLYSAANNSVGALWELSAPITSTPANDWNDLGYTYSKAVVARTKDNKWVAIFGNGYGSHLGKAALYVVDLETGALIKEIVVDQNTSGTAAEKAEGSGLSSPQIVVNAQYQIEKVYAGDLRGRLWKFDLSGTSSAWSSQKLFDAGVGHPITVQPLIIEHPSGGYLIEFGTGKLSEVGDKFDKALQNFYAIWDEANNAAPVLKSSLQAQSINGESIINGKKFFTSSRATVDWNTKKGWYLPLIYNSVATGERVIYPAQTTEGRVVFVTARVDATDPCQSSGGGRLVELDAFTGAMLDSAVLDTDNNGLITDADQTTSGSILDGGLPGMPVIIDKGAEKKTQTKIILLSTGVNEFIDEKAGSSEDIARRIMWRQLQ